MATYNIEKINLELEPKNWVCISDSYKNMNEELVFLCEEGHKVFATWKKIREKQECPVCKANSLKHFDVAAVNKEKGDFRLISLDAATRISGWAVFDNDKLVKYGAVEFTHSSEDARISALKSWILSLCKNWKPDLVVIEDIQLQEQRGKFDTGVTTYKVLAKLQGVLQNALFELKIPYEMVYVNTWRAAHEIRGKSKSEKKQSAILKAKKWYDITAVEDAAEAICLGRYGTKAFKSKVEMIEWN